jgi:hypothetical protein
MWRSNTLGGGKIRPAAGIGRRPRRAQGQRDRDEGRHSSCTSGEGETSTIPIVFTGGDPVEQGLVAGLARPGGNLTGFTFLLIELVPKRLELLSELVPEARVIALLVNPSKPEYLARRRAASVAHPGGQLPILKAATESEIDAAFASLVQLHAGALLVGPIRSSTTGASSWWRWRHAMRLRRAMRGASEWRPAA